MRRSAAGALWPPTAPARGCRKLLDRGGEPLILQSRLPEVILATYTAGQLMEGGRIALIDEQCRWADGGCWGSGPLRRLCGVPPGGGHFTFMPACRWWWIGDGPTPSRPIPTRPPTIRKILSLPRPGGMARLTGQSEPQIPLRIWRETAASTRAHYGPTQVCLAMRPRWPLPEGGIHINTSGTSAMAAPVPATCSPGSRGPSGPGYDETESARLGVYIHGRAGRGGSGETGCHGMAGPDLAEAIGSASGGKGRKCGGGRFAEQGIRRKKMRPYIEGCTPPNLDAVADNMKEMVAPALRHRDDRRGEGDGYGQWPVPAMAVDPMSGGLAAATGGGGRILRRQGIK